MSIINHIKFVTLITLLLGLNSVLAQETLTWKNDIPVGGWPSGTLGPHSNTTLCHSRGTFTSTVSNPSGITIIAGRPSNTSSNNNSIIHGMSSVPAGQGLLQTFAFGYPVENLSFSIFDIDGGNNSWRDRVIITASLAGTSIPVTITTCPPVAGTVCTGSGTNTVQIDAGTTGTGFTSPDGRADISIAGSLDSVTVQYQNHTVPTSSSQYMSISELTYSCAIVGVSKVMTMRAGQAAGVSPYIVDIDFNFENFGHVNLSNLTSLEDLDATFGAGTYAVTSITKTSGPASFTANAGFDGSATQELIGAASSLLPTETASIRVTLNVNNYGSYVNTITVDGTTPQAATTSDDSTDGTDADGADGDNNPDESSPSTIDTSLLPVSLNHLSVSKQQDSITVQWQTDIEFEHLGFEIYQENSTGVKQLESRLIHQQKSNLANAVKSYSYQFNSNKNNPIWLADIDNKGNKKWHGPFAINSSSGTKVVDSKINWNSVKTPTENSSDSSVLSDNLQIRVNKTGIQRIYKEDLVQAGLELTNHQPNELNISLNGKSVALYINGNSLAFDDTTSFDFYAQNINTLYTDSRVYKLSFAKQRQKHINQNQQTQSTIIESWYWQNEHYNPNLIYDFSSPTNDPWRADKIATFANNSKTILFPLDELAPVSTSNIELNIEITGGIDYPNPPEIYPTDPNRCGANHTDTTPGIPNDHCVELSLNGSNYSELVFDGLSNYTTSYQLDNSFAASGTLAINLKTPGESGYTHDIVHIEDVAISYPRRLTAINDKLEFQLANSTQIHNELINQFGFEKQASTDSLDRVNRNLPAIKVDGFSSDKIIAYSLDSGNNQRITNLKTQTTALGYSVSIPAIASSDRYWLSTEAALIKPKLTAWHDTKKIKQLAVDYIIISHPDFIETAQQLKELHINNGLSVEIVDINDIYQQFSESIIDPNAIRDFIKQINKNKPLSFILLVGADNYDYKGYLSETHFSHIPSIYHAIDDIVRYAPADSLYTDVNDDNIPDIAIGRLPVRTVGELQLLINKELTFINQKTSSLTSQFITDKHDDKYSYKQISNELQELVPQWNNIVTANRDDFTSDADTKQRILENFSQNPRLTTYLGHSGPRNWFSFPSAFTFNDIIDIDNSSSASVVMQWGCWNSYYVEPEANTMAHRFLFNNDKGAVAVFGASALTSVRSEKALAKLILPELAQPKQTIGQAMLKAKKELAKQGDYRDVIIGWNLLGDPALKLSFQPE